MRRLLPILLAAAVLLAAAAVAGVARPEAARGETAAQSRTVTTLGRGVVTTVPNVATISAGVQTEAVTAAAALAENARRMERVIAALKGAGADKLQTRQVSLYPRTNDKGKTTGFIALNGVTAETTIAKVGAFVDTAVKAGATGIDGPTLGRSDRDALYRDALAKAVDDARLKAEALGRTGRFGVGRIAAVVEQGATPVDVYAGDSIAAPKVSTPIEPGTQDVEANVSVSFEIA